MDGKGPRPLKAGASWQNGSKYNSALSALLHRVEPNASCLHPSFNYSQSAFFGQGPQPPLVGADY